jgi:IS4 transposase
MFAVVLDRFVQQCPLAVMARMTLQRALRPEWVDALFESNREWQYTRELTFSTVVEITSLVALGMSPSLHAAARRDGTLTVSMAALYAKVNHTEPALLRALVRGSAEQLLPSSSPCAPDARRCCPGFRVRVVDGNHLPASEKRLAPLRDFRGAALPGHALVVFDPELGLAMDLIPCEDAYASERVLMPAAMEAACAGDLWLADRHFSTRSIILGLVARSAHFIIREHKAHPNPTAVGPRRRIGRSETGVVFAQRVTIPTADGGVLRLRRIEIELYEPTSDGETLIRLLTNLPKAAADARTVASLLYLERWTVENLFQRLESALHSEVRTLGQPRAALLMFATAVVAFNVLSVAAIGGRDGACARARRRRGVDLAPRPGGALALRGHDGGVAGRRGGPRWSRRRRRSSRGRCCGSPGTSTCDTSARTRANRRSSKPKGYAPRKDCPTPRLNSASARKRRCPLRP